MENSADAGKNPDTGCILKGIHLINNYDGLLSVPSMRLPAICLPIVFGKGKKAAVGEWLMGVQLRTNEAKYQPYHRLTFCAHAF